MRLPLQPGDELAALTADAGIRLITRSTAGTLYALVLLFFKCDGKRYYGGEIDGSSRFDTKPAETEWP